MAAPIAGREGRTTRLLVLIPLIAAIFDDVGYVLLIRSQGDPLPDAYTFPFVAGFIALTAVLLAISLFDHPLAVRLRPALRAGAASGLLVLGVLGAFSIGLPLIIAGALATGAAVRTLAGGGMLAVVSEITAAVLVIGLLVTGFEVTARVIVCPTDGSATGGTWPGIVTRGFTWECVQGRAVFR